MPENFSRLLTGLDLETLTLKPSLPFEIKYKFLLDSTVQLFNRKKSLPIGHLSQWRNLL